MLELKIKNQMRFDDEGLEQLNIMLVAKTTDYERDLTPGMVELVWREYLSKIAFTPTEKLLAKAKKYGGDTDKEDYIYWLVTFAFREGDNVDAMVYDGEFITRETGEAQMFSRVSLEVATSHVIGRLTDPNTYWKVAAAKPNERILKVCLWEANTGAGEEVTPVEPYEQAAKS